LAIKSKKGEVMEQKNVNGTDYPKIRIKVCGMKYTANREAVEHLPVDYLGFIFFPGSKRFVGKSPELQLFSTEAKKVAVFVDENISALLEMVKNYGFDTVQLHGNESPGTCLILKQEGLKVIKAFHVDERLDFSALNAYDDVTDYFLFDTKTDLPGGSGKKFTWNVLQEYSGEKPFFLSGGIQPEDTENVKQFCHPRCFGIDLNSGFEDQPGLKNLEKLRQFITRIK